MVCCIQVMLLFDIMPQLLICVEKYCSLVFFKNKPSLGHRSIGKHRNYIILITSVLDTVCCMGALPEPLAPSTTISETNGNPAKSPPSSFTPVSSARRHKRYKMDRVRTPPTEAATLPNEIEDQSLSEAKLLRPSLRYSSFPHTSTLFSLFLNSPLLPPSTQWLYTQLYPNPYSAFHLKNSFEEIHSKDDEDERKSEPSEAHIRKDINSPNDFCKTSAKNITNSSNNKTSDVWRPY